ncbi:Tryptophan--tRNA ligase, mitochondrial [Ophidiomyces ophidiicola]|uniref:Tryptophan--tRNA ligase, mitochondrial n=1 Tax=Ophidiomyces ophidiicola TaxID=1387563 RepID=A0ACB8UPN6_9EURO|nr:Tryptophan--tRNA ligase, mitochondrial [Ophidiomyces ophidiicola]KAI1916561.1 Tryptophan--tRNA ligase, mitochondrial [Ophidiomyces ophidiicola]KAI1921205.1 Tryptophan--tRNA ligase, mitochondrial [Ophidiomyces ophidiicola]KAI2013705.1 Tryptophan--tRNA ligase, mitochondrial [Ophidiomyces ophidiicola]KAI2016642.1 Tryptophan--tRNA ligase, mitochondrial [Ophidiomyces ophidiicola]
MSIPARNFQRHTGFCHASTLRSWHPRCPLFQRKSITTTPHASRVIFSGIQPTGIPHLGNYLGALQQWVKLQNEAALEDKLLFSVVDLHALTLPQDPAVLQEWRRQSFAILLAVGLKPEKVALFFQSAVPAHTELMWILSTVSSMGYLSRMTQWKSKLQLPDSSTLDDSGARAKLRLGLFSYPVLQAADVLVHSATHVPVGEDQRQHLEFARDVANSFNQIYGPVLTAPDTLVSPAKRVMSLKSPESKMSKSDPAPNSRILLTDDAYEIKNKIKVALTDSIPGISYDPVNRPGVSNLLELLSNFDSSCHLSPAELAREHENSSLKTLKEHVAEKVANHLAPIRQKYSELMAQASGRDHLDTIAQEGARIAADNAHGTMSRVKDAIGL